ncbi:MAG: LamB/YcsF family protein [Candidatus Bathyarchaeia archaeon]
MYKVDFTADLGEGFGIYHLLDEEGLMRHLTSANVACGFHAGDPHVMRATLKIAKKMGLQVGAHPGLPDRIGFGRREIKVTKEELQDYVLYQMGALGAYLKSLDMKMQHVLPHGIMYTMACKNPDYADAIINAVEEYDKEVILVPTAGVGSNYLFGMANERGLRVAKLAILDMEYEDDGALHVTRTHDPLPVDKGLKKLTSLVKEGKLITRSGATLDYRPDGMLCHGDTPSIANTLAGIRERLASENIEPTPLKDII